MSRASVDHDSPLKNAGLVLSFGCVENRAETAHTESIKTGGTVPALCFDLGIVLCKVKRIDLLELPHEAWLVQQMIGLAIQIIEKDFSEMLPNILRRQRICTLGQ
jgi:hypothetical protein